MQFITSIERAKSEIPTLQSGKAPTKDPDNVGSHDFSKRPEAVIFGRGFEIVQVEDIRAACGGSSSGLVWLHSSQEGLNKVKTAHPDPNDPDSLDRYAQMTADVAKEVLDGIKSDGKWGRDGVYTYGMP